MACTTGKAIAQQENSSRETTIQQQTGHKASNGKWTLEELRQMQKLLVVVWRDVWLATLGIHRRRGNIYQCKVLKRCTETKFTVTYQTQLFKITQDKFSHMISKILKHHPLRCATSTNSFASTVLTQQVLAENSQKYLLSTMICSWNASTWKQRQNFKS